MAFPILPSGLKPDAQDFSESLEDVSMKSDVEGGYTYTRPKHTRLPRKTFTISYKGLRDADKAALETHFNSVRGGSLIFEWTHPKTSVIYAVRYKSGDGLAFKYVGAGTYSAWDCDFTLEQA